MAKQPSGTNHSFDIKTLRQLVKLMNENELVELDLQDGEQRIRLRKRGEVPVAVSAPQLASPVPLPQPQTPDPKSGATESAEKDFVEIKSPTLGSFYRAPSPDTDPFVQVGSRVEPDTIVCIVEAMKLLNEIGSDYDGVIRQVLIENGQPVEFGQPLFLVETK